MSMGNSVVRTVLLMAFVICSSIVSGATKPECGYMRTEENSPVVRQQSHEADFVVCGGGLAGVCAAVSAARHGVKVVLIQDRPVLGGNSSSEIRIGIKGAIGKNAKETGIIEEMEMENLYRNPSRRYTMWDDVVLSTVLREPNIKLLLNTSVDGVKMDGDRIASVSAWNSTATTRYEVSGKIFADCTGDGVLRMSGAKFRRGREDPKEFGETYLPAGNDSGTMGNTIMLQLRRTPGEDRPFRAPEWAYKFTEKELPEPSAGRNVMCNGVRVNVKRTVPNSNSFWWVEYGGVIDTIGDANDIQLELKKIAYGAWDYIKHHPDGRGKGWDLAWIGSLPGKRESTRFVGPHILSQGDILAKGRFPDVVAYGGWTFDDHDPEAFWNDDHISIEHAHVSPFGIPFRCVYSVNVPNLMFAGRNISVTHVGLSATRVMGTCALLGQAVGTAASLLVKNGILPAELDAGGIGELQDMLEEDDVMLPGRWRKPSPLTLAALPDPGSESLTNGVDRSYAGKDNGVWLEVGGSCGYSWPAPILASSVRIVFDTNLMRHRRMPVEEDFSRAVMPPMLARVFRLEVRKSGEWSVCHEEKENFSRVRRISFEPAEIDAIRLVVEKTWGGEKAHVFGIDVR